MTQGMVGLNTILPSQSYCVATSEDMADFDNNALYIRDIKNYRMNTRKEHE